MNEIKIKVKKKFEKRYKAGYPLLLKDAVENVEMLKQEGQIIVLIDQKGSFIGRGYVGQQNKGSGWIVSKNEKDEINNEFIEGMLRKAIKKRENLYNDTNTTAFRVFNGEGDGFGGVTIDYFDGYYLMNWYSKGVYEFKDMFLDALSNSVTLRGIYEKKRFSTDGQYVEDDDFVAGERAQFPLIVKENGIHFAVYLNEGAMVGVFLDQREVRQAIRDAYAKGKTILNTFSYTGAFSVAAALGGARKTTSVDLANRSLPKTKEQFAVNGIDFEEHDIIVQDVFNFFKFAVKKKLTYDLVILDPPSFARSKKHTFSAAKDYKNLLKEAIAITEKGGVIVASTNASNFGMDKFKQFISQGFKEMNSSYKLLEEFSLPSDFKVNEDFPEGNYLKVVFIQKRN